MPFLKIKWMNNSKHKKLPEEKILNKDASIYENTDEIKTNADKITNSFKLKYLGSITVEEKPGENSTSECVKIILKETKNKKRKVQRVRLSITPKGIEVTDLENIEILTVSVYNISNCSTDPTHRRVFSFLSTDKMEITKCHVFLCSKRKITESVTLAVAHAFSAAYEAWRILPSTKEFLAQLKQSQTNNTNTEERLDNIKNHKFDEKLIDFEDSLDASDDSSSSDLSRSTSYSTKSQNNNWVSFDDDFENQILVENSMKIRTFL